MAEERILVAIASAGRQRLEKVLAGHEVVFVETLAQARQALTGKPFGCVVLGVQFDESRTLRLLDDLRPAEHPAAPVMCVIGAKGRLSRAALDAFGKAARALGAREVLDMADYPDTERGNGALRQAIGSLLSASRPA